MPVRFVIGRSGTGKTTHCVRAIVDAARADPLGPPIFWILPRQATFTAERQLATETGLPAVCRVRVESFDGLARAVLNDCGGSAIPQVTAAGRRMILSHLLRQLQPQLKFFAAVAHHPGLAATLDATFAEFEKGGTAPEQVIAALDAEAEADDIDDLLRPKLSDLRLLYETYTRFLGQDRLDPHRRNEHVVGCLQTSKLLRGATVYVDGFFDYTESERRMICGLATTCARVEVTVLTDPGAPVVSQPDLLSDDESPFHRTESAFRRLHIAIRRTGATIDAPLLLRDVYRFSNNALRRVERDAFPVAATPASRVVHEADGASAAVTFTEANDRPTEVDAAARQIMSLLRQEHRMRDVAVLVRNLDDYQDLIDASFREHGIAFFLDRRRTAAHHPLLRLVRAAVRVATDRWPQSALFPFVKTGLAGLTLTEADELENYALDHRIRATDWTSAEPWAYRRSLTRGDDDAVTATVEAAARADALRRRVVGVLEPFVVALALPRPQPLRKVVTDLYAMLGRANVASTLAGWVATATARRQLEQAGEHQQVWAEFVEVLDQLVELLGDEPVSADAFADLLYKSLDAFDLALAPPSLDGVIVGQVERTRLPEVRATLILGLDDGEFPRTPREDSVLTDRDRGLLRRRDVEVAGDGGRQLLDERLLAYVAFTSPSASLHLSRVACDANGKAQAPSPYWTTLRGLFGDVPVVPAGTSDADDPSLIATPRQLVVSLLRWARAGARETGSEPVSSPSAEADETRVANPCHEALYQWLAAHPADDSPVARTRYRAWHALSYRNASSLRPETAAKLFASPIVASVSRIETFAACPFKHFLRYGLGLRERPDDGFSPLDLSRVYHDVLERLVRQMIRAKHEWRDLTDDWTDARVSAAAREIGAELQKDLAIEPGRTRYLLRRIERTVRQIVMRQRVLSSRAKLSGGFVGVSFGTPNAGVGPLRLKTPRGRELHVHGRIDRVDLLAGSNHAAVFDYKLQGDRISAAAVFNGLSLQLLTYLLVLRANGHELAGAPLTPAAGFYLQLLRGLKAVSHPDDCDDPATDRFHLDPKPRGVFDATHLPSLDAGLSGMSDAWAVHVKKEGGFGLRDSTDVCDADEFLGLLDHVRGKLETLADGIAAGDVSIRPYRLGKKSPCPHCGYRSVCRFDVTLNGYNHMHGIGRDEFLKGVRKARE